MEDATPLPLAPESLESLERHESTTGSSECDHVEEMQRLHLKWGKNMVPII